jgi:hypothetical protein
VAGGAVGTVAGALLTGGLVGAATTGAGAETEDSGWRGGCSRLSITMPAMITRITAVRPSGSK